MTTDIQVGDQVVCVEGTASWSSGPKEGVVYTVTRVYRCSMPNEAFLELNGYMDGWAIERFMKVGDPATSLENVNLREQLRQVRETNGELLEEKIAAQDEVRRLREELEKANKNTVDISNYEIELITVGLAFERDASHPRRTNHINALLEKLDGMRTP